MYKETPGEILKRLRNKKGLSQRALAAKAGVGREHINQIESGKIKSVTLRIAEALAKGLNEKPEVFFSPEIVTPVTMIPVYASFHSPIHEEPFDYVYYAKEKVAGKNIEAYRISSGQCLSPTIEQGNIVIVDRDRTPEPGNLLICLNGDEIIVGEYNEIGGECFLVNNEEKVYLKDVKTCAVIIEVIKRVV
jgi:transcriptional regulator with XRE-family HTH domain